MKILAVIVQNKRGQNQFVVSAQDFPHDKAVLQSKLLYNRILRQFKIGKKIDRSFVIDDQHICISNVSKDAIFMLIVTKNNLFLGLDGIKKLTEFYSRNIKQELPTKKYQEFFLMLEEFLYTRELPQHKLTFNFVRQDQFLSSKKIADYEPLNRFTHLANDIERNLIANIPLKYAKKVQIQEKEDLIINELMDSFVCYVQNVQNKELIDQARKQNFSIAFKLKTKVIPKDDQNRYQHKMPPPAPKKQDSGQKNQSYMSISSADMMQMKDKFKQGKPPAQINKKQVDLLGQEETVQQNRTQKSMSFSGQARQQTPQKVTAMTNDLLDLDYQSKSQSPQPKINNSQLLPQDLLFGDTNPISLIPIGSQPLNYHLRIIERMFLVQKDGRLKDIKMMGQICFEGDLQFFGSEELLLLGQEWNDHQGCQKRLSPNATVEVKQIRENAFRVSEVLKNGAPLIPIIDYMIPVKFFSQQRVPLILIYKLEVSPQNQSVVSFCLQYKVNEHFTYLLYDVEIEVHLQNDVKYQDIKSIPIANSVTNSVIVWKAKQLAQQQKGKLMLNLMGVNKAPQDILEFIKLAVKSNCSIINDLDCMMLHMVQNQEVNSQKRLLVEYKILPNQI